MADRDITVQLALIDIEVYGHAPQEWILKLVCAPDERRYFVRDEAGELTQVTGVDLAAGDGADRTEITETSWEPKP